MAEQSSAAIEHLSRGYERLTQLLALLLSSSPPNQSAAAPAIALVDKAMCCIASALSELQTNSSCGIDSATEVEESIRNGTEPRKRSRRRMQSWTIVTSVPHFDGHQWRKYGQKRIHSSEFPRSYYKCTHNKDQGCQATKTIQQKEDKISNPPKYVVSYSMHHTCKAIETHDTPFVMNSSAIINEQSTSSSSPAESPDLPPTSPSLAADIEQLLLSTEPRGKVNEFEDSSLMSPLAAFEFDWDWLMS